MPVSPLRSLAARLTPLRAALLATALVLPGAWFVIAQEEAAPPPREQAEIYSDLALFGQVFDRIRSEYVDVPDERELIHAAIEGMLSSLDPHSAFLPPQAYDETRENISGEFGGLGIEVEMIDGLIRVVSPIDETPAARAGILANDLIVALDGEPVAGLTLDEAVSIMRGEIGTPIEVTVQREGVSSPLVFDLERALIATRAVRWSMEGDVAIVRLVRFSEQAHLGLTNAINAIYAEREGADPAGIILDLRNNPGGLVDQSVLVSDVFLSQGAVVLTRGRQARENTRYEAQPDEIDAQLADVPVVVLINGGSASASEIVAGALQDHRRATVVGTRSFGKGSVQTIVPLTNNGAMQLTTARYYTPNNRSIQAAGIHPDIVVTQVVPEELQGRDEIIGEAGFATQIGGGSEETATVGSSVYVPADPLEDAQLQYAIRLVNGEETNPAYPPSPDAVVAQGAGG